MGCCSGSGLRSGVPTDQSASSKTAVAQQADGHQTVVLREAPGGRILGMIENGIFVEVLEEMGNDVRVKVTDPESHGLRNQHGAPCGIGYVKRTNLVIRESASMPSSVPAADSPEGKGGSNGKMMEERRLECEETDEDATWKYRKAEALREALNEGWIRLLRGSYIVQLFNGGGRIQRRQSMPDHAFWQESEVMLMLEEEEAVAGTRINWFRFLYVLSYRWLKPGHPDEEGHHLRIVAHVLEAAMRDNPNNDWCNGGDVAIFWDFPSLYQLPRTEEQQLAFLKGLGFLHVLYAHNLSTVLMQTEMPVGFIGHPYVASGWCYFESSVSAIFKSYGQRFDYALRGDGHDLKYFTDFGVMAKGKPPPITPEQFESTLDGKVFTNRNTDAVRVKSLYQKTWDDATRAPFGLEYQDRWTDEELLNLIDVLPRLPHLDSLNFGLNRFSDAALVQFFRAMKTNRSVKRIFLDFDFRSGSEVVSSFFEMIEVNATLTSYDCEGLYDEDCRVKVLDCWVASGRSSDEFRFAYVKVCTMRIAG